MYLAELFLKTLDGKFDPVTAQAALETCNRELCERMDGIVDEIDCLHYFFNTDANDEIISPNDRYQELIDFWDVYRGFDEEISEEVQKNVWILQMVYEADCNRILWEKKERMKRMSPEQICSLNMLCKEFEDKIGKKNLVLLRQEKSRFKVWKNFELRGFDGEQCIPEREFAENELIKMLQYGGMAILIVGRNGLTPRRYYGYRLYSNGYEKVEEKEIESLKTKLTEKNIIFDNRRRIRDDYHMKRKGYYL